MISKDCISKEITLLTGGRAPAVLWAHIREVLILHSRWSVTRANAWYNVASFDCGYSASIMSCLATWLSEPAVMGYLEHHKYLHNQRLHQRPQQRPHQRQYQQHQMEMHTAVTSERKYSHRETNSAPNDRDHSQRKRSRQDMDVRWSTEPAKSRGNFNGDQASDNRSNSYTSSQFESEESYQQNVRRKFDN